MAEHVTTILIVDDDEQIQRATRSILATRHYQVLQAMDGQQALELIAEHSPDLVILDLMLPGMNGLEVCREARGWYAGPILILSARGHERDKIQALDLGADDYLTKPFSTGELLARIRALLRRVGEHQPRQSRIDIGELHIDLLRRRVTRAGALVSLTPSEYDLLVFLANNLNCVVTSAMLIRHIWGEEAVCDTQTLRSHISHLRRKIEPEPAAPQYLVTEPGVGFRLTTPEE
ncbi:MAG: response regulator transcription factor [Armatimonadota bacterium]